MSLTEAELELIKQNKKKLCFKCKAQIAKFDYRQVEAYCKYIF